MQSTKDRPILSVIVAVREMDPEALRTLFTLSPEYQGFPQARYEVIVIDDRSTRSLGEEAVRGIADNFHYTLSSPDDSSPAGALNLGASLSRGKLIGFMIDGTCMLSPGILKYAARAARAYDHPIVSTPGYLLRRAPQQAAAGNHRQASEDPLLTSVEWRRNGYELFRVASPAPSNVNGALAPLIESHCVFVTPRIFDAVGGFHPGFGTASGNLVNRDFYREVCEHPESDLVVLLGEGTFRQFDSAATAAEAPETSEEASEQAAQQYEAIRGKPFAAPVVVGDLLGSVPSSFIPGLGDALGAYERLHDSHPEIVASLGKNRRRPSDRSIDEDSTSRTIIILGMHRSGTSMLTGILQEAGLEIGSVDQDNPTNRKGNRENWAVLHMQEDLLERSGGAWNDVPDAVQWHTVHRAIRDEFIAGFAGVKIWGFKDPRTIFTLDGWLEVLPDAECVGFFRHPMLVANSLHPRDGFTIEHGLALWQRYNEKLLEIGRARPLLLIEFEDDPVRLTKRLQWLTRRLDLPWKFRAPRFFEDQLRHRLPPEVHVPDDILTTYEDLRRLAASTDGE